MKHITKKEMIEVLDNSKSLREAMIKFGFSTNGSSAYSSFKNKIMYLGLEIPNYTYYGDNTNKRNKRMNNVDIFIENSTYPRQRLKNRVIKDNLIEYKCSKCNNIGEWNGEKLSLHIDHINGVNNDNRLFNLRFLCPNCHSQTETYAGKSNKKIHYCECGNEKKSKQIKKCDICRKIEKEKKEKLNQEKMNKYGGLTNNQIYGYEKQRKIKRPTYEQLMIEIKTTNYSAVGRKYNVSDNTIRKWKKYYENGSIA